MELTLAASLHHLVVSSHVGCNEDHLRTEAAVGILEELHGIGSSASLARVPKDHPLRWNILVDQAGDRWSKRLLLVGANPNEEPGRRVSLKLTGRDRRGQAIKKTHQSLL